ncbi:signal peptidase II, partial [Erysipelatoclostridium ramosum]|nr:signal peptidase II [Thomasclavelia ramosa]
NITRVHNTGVAFGLGNGTVWSSYLFLAVPVLAIVVLVVLYRKNLFHTAWLTLAYVLLLAGVAGNLTDRLIQGFLIPYEQQH